MILGFKEQKQSVTNLAKNGQLGHAYLFFGPPQVGKATFAKDFAIYLEAGAWPESESQRPLTDALMIAPDEKGTIGIDAVRTIRAFLQEKPFVSARRTVIIDRAELLGPEAQNALLKVAEEPPESALLILVLPDPEALWATLRSRFQQLFFSQVARQEIEGWLKSKGADAKKAAMLAKSAEGRPGLALDLYMDRGAETRELAARFFETPPAARKDFIKEVTEPEDFNFAAFLDSLIAHLAATSHPHSELWHAVLELRRMQDATNLSPRIQLMNLWNHI